jgi:hypothetical protein
MFCTLCTNVPLYFTLKDGLCSAQEVKLFACLIFPFFPVVVDGELWLFCATECPATPHLEKQFIENARILSQEFFSDFSIKGYEMYWKKHKVGDFNESAVTLKVRVFEPFTNRNTRQKGSNKLPRRRAAGY